MKRPLLKPNTKLISATTVGMVAWVAITSGGLAIAPLALAAVAGLSMGIGFSFAQNLSHNERINHLERMEAMAAQRKKRSAAQSKSLLPTQQIVWNPIRYEPDSWTGPARPTGQIKGMFDQKVARLRQWLKPAPADRSAAVSKFTVDPKNNGSTPE